MNQTPTIWSRLILASLLATVSASPAAEVKMNAVDLNPSETWVVEQVTAGQIADLSVKFVDENERKLGARFLEHLVTDTIEGVQPHRNGVRISGAIFDQAIGLANAQIPFEVALEKCRFVDEVNCDAATFLRTVSFEHSTFHKAAKFYNMKAKDAAVFQSVVFEGGVSFASANIASNFEMHHAKFNNRREQAVFNSIKVGHTAFFYKAIFEGPVDFVSASIVANFEADEAEFRSRQHPVKFNRIKVGGSAYFRNAILGGGVDFRYADLHLLSVSPPKIEGPFDMRGMTYKYIDAGRSDQGTPYDLLELAKRSPYTADVYRALEEFFAKQGRRDDADRVFVAGKQRERREHLRNWSWLSSSLLDLIGYGRYPSHVAYLCALIVAFGATVFSSTKMELQRTDTTPRIYNRFWYSLGLFLPVVNLESDKVWKPKAEQTFLRTYMRIHILLGWILVPLFLAALNGLIK